MQNQPDPSGAQPMMPPGAQPMMPPLAPPGAPPAPGAQVSAPAAAQAPVNTYGLKALLASLASLIVTAITAFVFQRVFIYIALLGVYAVYAGLRGIFTAFRVPKQQGLILSILGLILGVVAIIFTVWLFIP